MICGPSFPFPKAEFDVPGQAFFDVLGSNELLEKILADLGYTDRASLSQICRAAAVGVRKCQTVWLVNREDFGDAEFQEEEFTHIAEAGEMWNVTAPRGAKVSMHPTQSWMYQSIPHLSETLES